MKHLLFDIGNSFAKIASYENKRFNKISCIPSAVLDKDVAVFLDGLTGIYQSVILASVADKKITESVVEILKRKLNCFVVQVQTEAEAFGVRCGYSAPSLLGVDRWLAILGAFNHGKLINNNQAMLVIDCGSVVTVDVVVSNGEHLGGWMMPNRQLMIESLDNKSTGIHKGLQDEIIKGKQNEHQINSSSTSKLIGRSTTECIELGGQLAVVGFLEQCFQYLQNKTSLPYKVFITGGGAEDVISNLSFSVEYLPDLVFDGLSLFIE